MSDLHARLEAASQHLVSRWSPERAQLAWDGMPRARRRASNRRLASVTVAMVAVLVVVGLWQLPRGSQPAPIAGPTPPASASSTTPLLVLEDGSRVEALNPDAAVGSVRVRSESVQVRLVHGAARFVVTPGRARVFEVLAADVRATVLGTVFTVDLRADVVALAVERGRVRLSWPGGEVDVGPGEQHLVPRRHVASTPPPTPASASADAAVEQPPNPTKDTAKDTASPASADWRALARQGKYDQAYDVVERYPRKVRDNPGDLLLAADVARASGHPSAAIQWLERVVQGHSGDSRAPLAAFTIGRVRLEQLGQAAAAADAFATARQLAPGGALAEDALAREVESRARAGQSKLTRQLAREYLHRYPTSLRAAAVRRHAGLEAPAAPSAHN